MSRVRKQPSRKPARIATGLLLLAPLLVFTSGCEIRQRMYNQPRHKPLSFSEFYADGAASRPLMEGTVARGFMKEDDVYYTGRLPDGSFVDGFPFEVSMDILKRGQERYNIYCATCHDRAGTGNGYIVLRGYKQPPSLHVERLRDSAPGYFYQVISKGYGVMPSYAYQVKPEDRWAIAAYIRVLQLSQRASLDDVPAEERAQLEALLQ